MERTYEGEIKMKIAFFDSKPYDRETFDAIKEKFKVTIKYYEGKLTQDSVALTKGYTVVCAFVNDTLDKAVIDSLYENGVRLVAMRCAGYNNVDFKAAFGKVHVVRVPAYSPYAVAEHTFALLSTLNRKIHKAYNRTRDNNFNIAGLTGMDLHGKTLGIIGTGKIGQIVSTIGLGYGMKILAYDMFPKELENVSYVDLDTLYKNSDVITLHCPLTKESHHMINASSIAKMKERVILINTSRGGLINTEDLIEGIKNHKIGSAGLDVYEEEGDYFFEDFSNEIIEDDVLARLLSFGNVLVTAHQAFLTKEALANIADTTLTNVKEFMEDKPLQNEICYQCTSDKTGCKHDHKKNCF